jgi:hypothetical protein
MNRKRTLAWFTVLAVFVSAFAQTGLTRRPVGLLRDGDHAIDEAEAVPV